MVLLLLGAVGGRPDVLPNRLTLLPPINSQLRSSVPAKPVKEKPIVPPKQAHFSALSNTSSTSVLSASISEETEEVSSTNATKDLRQNFYSSESGVKNYNKHVQ